MPAGQFTINRDNCRCKQRGCVFHQTKKNSFLARDRQSEFYSNFISSRVRFIYLFIILFFSDQLRNQEKDRRENKKKLLFQKRSRFNDKREREREKIHESKISSAITCRVCKTQETNFIIITRSSNKFQVVIRDILLLGGFGTPCG